uniref:Uncharacterized protein n=1 Tax=viral metagenome TaxID=1070528 RepID=A0A6M3K607_9ZZZZ
METVNDLFGLIIIAFFFAFSVGILGGIVGWFLGRRCRESERPFSYELKIESKENYDRYRLLVTSVNGEVKEYEIGIE